MKINLSPLRVEINPDFTMLFEGRKIKPNIRHLSEMKDVVLDKEFYRKVDKRARLYYMYRGLQRKEDVKIFAREKIRFDITVIPPRQLGCEFVKTAGHYHPSIKGGAYTEIYEVLRGSGLFLLQKRVGNKIKDVVIIEGKRGDKIIVPPNCGHITINKSRATLVMSNLVSSVFKSRYKPILKKHGGAYFICIDGVKKNKAYKNLPKLRKIRAKKIKNMRGNMYRLFIKNPKMFEFLNNPAKYKKLVRAGLLPKITK